MVEPEEPLVVRLPPLGESVDEARIARFFKKPGDTVARHEPVVDVETDKADVQIDAPESGVIASLSAAETVKVGDVLFTMHVRRDAPAPEPLVVRMPRVSESGGEYTIARFFKRPGDVVRRDEPIVEIEDAKVTLELTAPESGILTSITPATQIRTDEPLYALHVQDVPPPPPPPPRPPPSPRPISEAERAPLWFTMQLTWDVRHIQARAQSLAGPGLEPRMVEASLFWQALVQALVAVPKLHVRLIDRTRGPAAILNHCELEPGALRWLNVSLGPGSSPAFVLSQARPLRGRDARIEVIRIASPVPLTAPPARPIATGLSVVIGPVTTRAVVEDGAIVARPRASLALNIANGHAADELLAFAAALAEQLTTV